MCMCQICLPFYFCCITISHLVYCSPLLICLQDSFCNHILAKVTILNEPVKSSLRLESGCPIILHHWRQFGPSYLPNISFSKFQPHSLSFGYYISQFSSVQSLSLVWLSVSPWTAAHQASLSITNSRSPSKPMSIVSVMPSNHLILCFPLLLLPSIFPNIRVFSNESALHIRWPKYWSFSFSISPSNEHPELISFRVDWLDLWLAVEGTLKSLLQHHN